MTSPSSTSSSSDALLLGASASISYKTSYSYRYISAQRIFSSRLIVMLSDVDSEFPLPRSHSTDFISFHSTSPFSNQRLRPGSALTILSNSVSGIPCSARCTMRLTFPASVLSPKIVPPCYPSASVSRPLTSPYRTRFSGVKLNDS